MRWTKDPSAGRSGLRVDAQRGGDNSIID